MELSPPYVTLASSRGLFSKPIFGFVVLDLVLFSSFGPSEVRALPLGAAVERNVHYFGIIFFFFPSHNFFSQGSLGFCMWFQVTKNKISGEKETKSAKNRLKWRVN